MPSRTARSCARQRALGDAGGVAVGMCGRTTASGTSTATASAAASDQRLRMSGQSPSGVARHRLAGLGRRGLTALVSSHAISRFLACQRDRTQTATRSALRTGDRKIFAPSTLLRCDGAVPDWYGRDGASQRSTCGCCAIAPPRLADGRQGVARSQRRGEQVEGLVRNGGRAHRGRRQARPPCRPPWRARDPADVLGRQRPAQAGAAPASSARRMSLPGDRICWSRRRPSRSPRGMPRRRSPSRRRSPPSCHRPRCRLSSRRRRWRTHACTPACTSPGDVLAGAGLGVLAGLAAGRILGRGSAAEPAASGARGAADPRGAR